MSERSEVVDIGQAICHPFALEARSFVVSDIRKRQQLAAVLVTDVHQPLSGAKSDDL